jgi:hypothetical protein
MRRSAQRAAISPSLQAYEQDSSKLPRWTNEPVFKPGAAGRHPFGNAFLFESVIHARGRFRFGRPSSKEGGQNERACSGQFLVVGDIGRARFAHGPERQRHPRQSRPSWCQWAPNSSSCGSLGHEKRERRLRERDQCRDRVEEGPHFEDRQQDAIRRPRDRRGRRRSRQRDPHLTTWRSGQHGRPPLSRQMPGPFSHAAESGNTVVQASWDCPFRWDRQSVGLRNGAFWCL